MVKYKAPEILKKNFDKFAQKFEVNSVPETIFPIILSPPKKIIKPIMTFRCITSFCFDGATKANSPKVRISSPSIAGV